MENIRKAAIQAAGRAEMLEVLIKALAPVTVAEHLEQMLIESGRAVPARKAQEVLAHLRAVQKAARSIPAARQPVNVNTVNVTREDARP